MKKKLISGLLTAALTLGLLGAGLPAATSVSYGASFSDIDEHWAKTYILEAADKGIITGYPDGTFLPDKPVTRAEFAKMINNTLGNENTAAVDFSDVPAIEWYYNEISKAISAGYVGGYDDGTFLPNNKISRQEAAVMISRIIPAAGYSANLTAYADYASIGEWAHSSLSRVVGKKYIGPYDDGLLHPLDSLTRAQAAKILNDISKKETIVKSSVTVKTADTKLANTVYSNGLTIGKAVGDGMVTVDNCVVLGSMFVQGGGSDDIIIEDSRIASMHVSKNDSSVGILAKGDTRILDTVAWKSSVLHTRSLGGGLFGTGYDVINVYNGADVTLDGNYPKIKVRGADAYVNFEAGTLETLEVEASGKNCEVTLGKYATISTADIDAITLFKGTGDIKTLNANVSGILYETKPSLINVKDGVTAPKYAYSDLNISYTPARGASDIDVETDIKLSFSSQFSKYDGKSVSNEDLAKLIELRKGSSSGDLVAFTASKDSSGKTITIVPASDLAFSTKYYVIIDANTFKDAGGVGNDAFSTYFTTEADNTPVIPNAALTGLSVTSSAAVTPSAFSAGTLNYSVQMPSGTSEASINATAASGAIILYSKDGTSWSTDVKTFLLSPSAENKIYIKVAESGKYSTTYVLTITVAPAP